jgi:hypothetical protein
MQKGPRRITRTRSGPWILLQDSDDPPMTGCRRSAGDTTTWPGTAGGHLNGVGEADGAVALPPLSPAGRRASRLEVAGEQAPEKALCIGGKKMLQATLNQPPWRPKEGEAASHHTARKAGEQALPGSRGCAQQRTPPRHLGRSGAARQTRHAPLPNSSSPPWPAGRRGASQVTTTQEHGGTRPYSRRTLLLTPHTASGSHLESTAARRQEQRRQI